MTIAYAGCAEASRNGYRDRCRHRINWLQLVCSLKMIASTRLAACRRLIAVIDIDTVTRQVVSLGKPGKASGTNASACI
jgi:hypothetical protein